MNPWEKLQLAPASCMPLDCFCEALRDCWIRQPVNSWSNLAFILVGLYLLWKPLPENINLIKIRPFLKKLYAFNLIFLGLGSFFFHASITFLGQWFDVFFMFSLLSFVCLYIKSDLSGFHKKRFVFSFFILSLLFGGLLYGIPEMRRSGFAVLTLFTFFYALYWIKMRKNELKKKNLFLAMGILSFSFFIWVLDKEKVLCWPHSFFQGHALWHILDALACLYFYKFFEDQSKARLA